MAADALTSLSPDENPARADALGAALSHYIAGRVGGDHVALIIDDAHALGTDGPAAQLIAAIVRHAPNRFTSCCLRGALPFPTGRLLVDGLATEIDRRRVVVHGRGGRRTARRRRSPPSRRRPSTRCSTEPAAGRWRSPSPPAPPAAWRRRRAPSDRGDRQLFAYFAEEVLAAESAATRAALRVAATLPWLTTELAAHLGLGEAGARLADPERYQHPDDPGRRHAGSGRRHAARPPAARCRSGGGPATLRRRTLRPIGTRLAAPTRQR